MLAVMAGDPGRDVEAPDDGGLTLLDTTPGRELEPVAVPGCDVCQSCDQEREPARRGGRSLTVRSCNAVIAGHPHGREVLA
jgi:hypothetical protein